MVNLEILKGSSHGLKLSALVMLVLIGSAFGNLSALGMFLLFDSASFEEASALLDNPSGSEKSLSLYRYILVSQAFFMFVFPAFIFFRLIGTSAGNYLGNIKKPSVYILVITALLVVFSSPIIELTHLLNLYLRLPNALEGLEIWIIEQEQSLSALTKALLAMPSWSSLAYNLVLTALLPAVGEELIFRGIIQKELVGVLKNTHAGIWITAFVFSLIHFQFYGFLPRFLLGALFGYLFIWSGSLYYSIAAHFLNNASVVVLSYLFQHQYIQYDVFKNVLFPSKVYYICIVVSMWFLFMFYLNTSMKNKTKTKVLKSK